MMKGFADMGTGRDVINILEQIRTIILKIETNTSAYDALDKTKRLDYMYRQEENESNSNHLRNFKSIVKAVEY